MNLLGPLEFIDSVADFGSSPELDGPVDVVTAEINGQTFVYVASFNDAGIQVLTLDDNGALEPLTSTPDTGAIGLDGVVEIDLIEFNNESFLVTTSTSDQISMFRIDDDGNRTDGHLVALNNYVNFPSGTLPDAGAGVLDFPEGLDTATIDGKNFIAIGAYNSDALSIFRVARNGDLTRTDTVNDAEDPDYLLNGAREPVIYNVGNKTYVYIGGDIDGGINVFELDSSGKLDFVQAVSGAPDAYQLVAMEFNGKDYLFTSDNANDSIQVYSIGNNGQLSFVSETPRFIDGTYSDVWDLEPLVIDGVEFLAATARNQNTFVVMSLDSDEQIQVVQTHTDASELSAPRGFETIVMGDKTYLLSTALNSDRISMFEIGAQDDPLVGTQDDDRIVGMNGDDDLLGLRGNDQLIGGRGDDVLSGRAGKDDLSGGEGDDVLIGGAGNDTLDGGSGTDVLIGGAGVDTAVFRAVSEGVSVNLAGTSTSTAVDSFFGIENIVGSRFADTIVGDDGDNKLGGGQGSDTILGGDGADRASGGTGADDISGEGGNDRLFGQAGGDTLDGGDGRDRLIGAAGSDVLLGGAGNDNLNGGGGTDILNGGEGNDTLKGGGGADLFVFVDGDGNDAITDFDRTSDVIDLQGVTGLDSLADVRNAAIELRGDVVILLDGGNSITIEGIREGQLSNDNFDFG